MLRGVVKKEKKEKIWEREKYLKKIKKYGTFFFNLENICIHFYFPTSPVMDMSG